jgi:Ca2+-transporting ATPase
MTGPDQKSSYQSLTVEQVLETMSVDPRRGLTDRDIRRRLDRHGLNRSRKAKSRSIWKILAEQFKSMVIVVLVIAGTVALAFGHLAEGIAIAAVLFMNAALGFTTEWKAMR